MANAKAVSLTIDMMTVDQHLTEVIDRWLKILVRGLWGGVSCFKSLHSCHTDPVKIYGRRHVRCPLHLTIDLLFKELDGPLFPSFLSVLDNVSSCHYSK